MPGQGGGEHASERAEPPTRPWCVVAVPQEGRAILAGQSRDTQGRLRAHATHLEPTFEMAAVEPGTRASSVARARPRRPRKEQPELPYLNRELSWLEFNARVLHEARDARNPLLERAKFLAIFAGNLDEFFQVRVAGLRQQIEAGAVTRAPDGRTPGEQVAAARERVLSLIADHSAIFG